MSGDRTEQLLVRSGTAQQEPDAVRAGRSERRVPKCQAAQPLDQGIGRNRQQLPERVGPEAVTGRPVGKEVQLLVLEAVLQVAACAVHPIVEADSNCRIAVGWSPRGVCADWTLGGCVAGMWECPLVG